MTEETKNCQNCKKDFTIEPDDFSFYEKIKVPPPTFCSWCRFLRRMMWRNERSLYKRECDLCDKKLISIFTKDIKFPAYCAECWYGDGWDAATYGRDYDFSKPFLLQYKELSDVVPHRALWQRNSINSDYSNMVAESKNVYLSASVVDGSENVFYSKNIDHSFNICDSYNLKHCEQCYENVEGSKNYNSQHLFLSRNSIDSYFLIDCANCSNCFMSSNLRSKQYYFRNEQYSKEDYLAEVARINFGSREGRQKLIEEFSDLKQKAIYKYANLVNSPNSTGNNLTNMKNCLRCFDGYDGEDFKYSFRNFTSKDCMDCDFNQTSELMYEYLTGGLADYNIRFAFSVENSRDIEYSQSCRSSSNLFGCFGVNKGEYMILNKAYSKEEFLALREKIIKHMKEMPYIDKQGRVYSYGEYFPPEICPHGYNETLAQEFEPLLKEQALKNNYSWKDAEEKNPIITTPFDKIPDDINTVDDKILKETLGCVHADKCNHQCSGGFRITQGELQFYKQHNIPLPDKCANCRYYERFNQVPLPKLYHRTCMKCNKVEFETPYAPDRPEKVYCESCYNKEVY